MFLKIQQLFIKYERHIMPAAFIFGFVMDNLTLRRVDLWLENLVLIVYLSIAGLIIFLLNILYGSRKFHWEMLNQAVLLLPLFLQGVFGALFSAFFVFYLRSASFASSWFFLLFLGFILIGNEFFRKRYQNLTFHLSIYFIAVFSYFIFVVPILTGKIGAAAFILSGFLSFAFILLFLHFLEFAMTNKLARDTRKSLFTSIGIIYVLYHFLYFTNIIPPIPLSLVEGGIYHVIEKGGGDYMASFEPVPWYLFFYDTNPTVHWVSGDSVYAYSAVFAPTKLQTKIVHKWSYYDTIKDKWVEESKFEFSIVGGRDGGYRGFSIKYGLRPGKWRVQVETKRGQVLGRIKFKVVEVVSPPRLETKKLQ